MRSASATEVPPNFMTKVWDMARNDSHAIHRIGAPARGSG
jgi:hypothetical protein